ncbi:MAG: SDR family oxidoreductase [Ktedonobacteraceae bacterium]
MTDFTGRVLVLGASGQTGNRVISALEKKQIPARALVRSQEQAQAIRSNTTETVIGELTNQTLQDAFIGITGVISALGTRNFDAAAIQAIEYTVILDSINAARAAQVRHFVLCSSMGTSDPESIPFLTAILRVKRQAEIALEQSGLAYTIIHPGGLLNTPGGEGVLVVPHPTPQHGTISREDVAEVLVQALLQPAARNQSVDILNQPDQGAADRSGLFSEE